MDNILSILIGLVSGISSGFFGIGGAIILIPSLVYVFKFSQHLAQGTALTALLLPVGILAVIKYYKSGDVNIKVALFIALGFIVGGFVGATLVQAVPSPILKKVFAVMLLCISVYMLVGK
ncbi:MAG: sulfite exporter TauE/SafE family protein [Candidatus Omnitrophota bacterium]|nr:MAG: permease [Omnitrophica bacterium GWA2_41_15]HAZ10094.1 permease [Candidatus Omnitrophota bacterium]